jgi:hypothetical protein
VKISINSGLRNGRRQKEHIAVENDDKSVVKEVVSLMDSTGLNAVGFQIPALALPRNGPQGNGRDWIFGRILSGEITDCWLGVSVGKGERTFLEEPQDELYRLAQEALWPSLPKQATALKR